MLPQWPAQEVGSSTGVSATQLPFWHALPAAQLPQLPPQPSSPQVAVWHLNGVGLHRSTHLPRAHTFAPLHAPQLPPQPSAPQSLPEQVGTHVAHVPLPSHTGLKPEQPATASDAYWQSGSGTPQPQLHASSAA